jgi:hypothetical protein
MILDELSKYKNKLRSFLNFMSVSCNLEEKFNIAANRIPAFRICDCDKIINRKRYREASFSIL